MADFAFKREALIVEVDGGQHGGPRDAERDAALNALGYEVMRIWTWMWTRTSTASSRRS